MTRRETMKRLRVLILVLLLLLPSTVRAEGQDFQIITKDFDDLKYETTWIRDDVLIDFVSYSTDLKPGESVEVIMGQPICLFNDYINFAFPIIIDDEIVSVFIYESKSENSSSWHYVNDNFVQWLNGLKFSEGSVVSFHKDFNGTFVTDGEVVESLASANVSEEVKDRIKDKIKKSHNEILEAKESIKLVSLDELKSPSISKVVSQSDIQDYFREKELERERFENENSFRYTSSNYFSRNKNEIELTADEFKTVIIKYFIIFVLTVIATFSVLKFYELRKKRKYMEEHLKLKEDENFKK